MDARSGLYPFGGMDLAQLLQRPTYTVPDAARWAETTRQTARRWIAGYHHHGDRWSAPVTARRGDDAFLSFEDLVEVAVVAAIRRQHISMGTIRQAVGFAKGVLDVERPLVTLQFKHDGRQLFLGGKAVHEGYTNLNRFGQLAMATIEDVLKDVDYEADLASSWWPIGREQGIIVDPRVNFGRPVIASLGVRTESLADRWSAGDSIVSLADEYNAPQELIERAVRFEVKFPIAA